ncbi:CCA tRNA nucleotidyltransferase [Anaerovirgula multivorans]|nr:CCA tRNA nucleotidyltransferase [Anaerovirgula multivorans]
MKTLEMFNYEVYIVGGSVRDSLLKRIPKDWDVTTNASPREIITIFKSLDCKVVETGLKHGTVTVVINNNHYEVTTFRIDGKYSDCRKPDCVSFTESLKEDLSRRDFTINAMAYNNKVGLIDYFEGIKHLNNKIITSVGKPDDRFNEDALRMLRAVRLSTTLGFSLDSKTSTSIFKNRNLIKNISTERIRDEFIRILIPSNPLSGIELLRSLGLLEIILPEFQKCYGFEQRNPNHDKDVYYHILNVLENTSNKLEIRLAALLHDIGKPSTFTLDENGIGHFYKHHLESEDITRKVLDRLRFDNRTIDNVCILVREHMSRYDSLKIKNAKKLINRVGIDNLNSLFELQIADIKGSTNRDSIDKVLDMKAACERILNEKQPLSIKDLDINGNDLIKLGFKQGKQIGKVLNELLDVVLEEPEFNKKDKLIDYVKSKMT